MKRTPCDICGKSHNAKGDGRRRCSIRYFRDAHQTRLSRERIYGRNMPAAQETTMTTTETQSAGPADPMHESISAFRMRMVKLTRNGGLRHEAREFVADIEEFFQRLESAITAGDAGIEAALEKAKNRFYSLAAKAKDDGDEDLKSELLAEAAAASAALSKRSGGNMAGGEEKTYWCGQCARVVKESEAKPSTDLIHMKCLQILCEPPPSGH